MINPAVHVAIPEKTERATRMFGDAKDTPSKAKAYTRQITAPYRELKMEQDEAMFIFFSVALNDSLSNQGLCGNV